VTTTLHQGWWGTDLGPYRACSGTYCLFDVASLPPLPPLDGTFSWLPAAKGAQGAAPDRPVVIPDDPAIPASYVTFMNRPDLMAAIPSCTACYWSPAAQTEPWRDGSRLLRFLTDQQDVLFWMLWLGPGGDHRVVCGDGPDRLVEVAPSFEAFIYRYWVENVAWFELNEEGRPEAERTPAVRAYLAAL
jgi:hypothetical protein